MITVILDGSEISSIDEVHEAFSQALELPDWYGNNLDALYDCLTELSDTVTVKIFNTEALGESLGRHWEALITMLGDASAMGSVELEISEE